MLIAFILILVVWWVIDALTFDVPVDDVQSVATTELFERPDMSATIATIFDKENSRTGYEWAITGNQNGRESLVETVTFLLSGQTHSLQLSTMKANEADEMYTVTDYLSVTISVPSGDTHNVLILIDTSGDGDLDAAYINDVAVTDDDAYYELQNQYVAELVTIRNYLAGI